MRTPGLTAIRFLLAMGIGGALSCATNPCKRTEPAVIVHHAKAGACTLPQGGIREPACNVASAWRVPGQPHLRVWAELDCPVPGGLQVTVDAHDGHPVSDSVAIDWKPDKPRVDFETPSFLRPQSGTHIEVRLAGKCANGENVWTTTACPMP